MFYLRRYLQQHRRAPLARYLARRCVSILSQYNNLDYEIQSNGEAYVLQTLSRFPLKTFFDVGANIGDWTKAAAESFPNASIYSFEAMPQTFQTLSAATGRFPHVRRINEGLSNKAGTLDLHYYDQSPALTTFFEFPHNIPARTVTVPMATGDAYCRAQGISHIDFLKIDVEGMENWVLEGFQDMFSRSAIDLVQFEYGRINILTRFLLHDFYEFFRKQGFAVGKIYPNYVDFRDYKLDDEDFMGPNFLACRQDKIAYLNALKD